MSSCLKSKALRIVTNEGLQDFIQSLNKLGPGDNLMAIGKARMPIAVNNG